MPKAACENLEKLRNDLKLAENELKEFLEQGFADFSADSLLSFEEKLGVLSSKVAALQFAIKLQEYSLSEAATEKERELVSKCKGKYRDMGWRPHQITSGSGHKTTIYVRYFARKCAQGKGFNPLLLLGGLGYRTTPLMASRAAMFAAALSSFKEAQNVLGTMGISLDVKTISRITAALGMQASAARDQLIKVGSDNTASPEDTQRVVLSTDGGRIRIRRPKSGPKGKQGRSRYHSEWKEPKLIIIYFVGSDGRQSSQTPPIIDTTLAGPDAAIALLRSYLEQLNLDKAQFSFVSDGAKWIWCRVKSLFESLGIAASRVILTLDFYHAAEHLNVFASHKANWSDAKRKSWVNKMKKWLKNGKASEVISELRQQAKWTRCKQLQTEVEYFESHEDHLDYAASKELGLPIGSGAVESAIRRVLNLKLKSPGIHWGEEGAAQMLLLRSFFKAGRWSSLVRGAMAEGGRIEECAL